MRIGILTYHWNYNYGAVLQAAFLREQLLRLGAKDVVFLDYRPSALAHHASSGWGLRTGRTLPILRKRLAIMRFRAKHCPSTPRIRTADHFRAIAASFDMVIVGSDQVWNHGLVGECEGPMFLDVPLLHSSRKASYAASFGNAMQPRDFLDKASPALREIGSLSVRDRLSQSIVREAIGADAQLVIDPTLLLDSVCPSKRRSLPEKYALAYFVDVFDSEAKASVDAVRDVTGLPVVAVSVYRDLARADIVMSGASIEEWLYLFEKASLVISDSFHGTVFSIKNKRRFFTLCRSDVKAARIADLLESIDATSSVYETADELRAKLSTAEPLDFCNVEHVICAARKSSQEFIVRAMAQAEATLGR